jgi:predicted oxidoreductase
MPLIRIVKMTFKKEAIVTFQKIFDERAHRCCPGCAMLELLRDGNILFHPIPYGKTKPLLRHIVTQELFTSTWSLVKPLFSPEAGLVCEEGGLTTLIAVNLC